jgi:hypothetical protein
MRQRENGKSLPVGCSATTKILRLKGCPPGFAEYVGTYELASGNTLTIATDGKQLYRQRGDRARELLTPKLARYSFRTEGEGRLLFRRSDNQTIDALIDRRNNEDVVWKKIK